VSDERPTAPTRATFICEGCREHHPCPITVLCEYLDGRVYPFCKEACAMDWLKRVLNSVAEATKDTDEIDLEKVAAALRRKKAN